MPQPNDTAAVSHSSYPLWLTNHAKQCRHNTAILSMRGQAHIPRHNTLVPRPTASRGQPVCAVQPATPPQADAPCNDENLVRQSNLAQVESTLWIQPVHSNCRTRR